MEKREMVRQLLKQCPFVNQYPCSIQGLWELSKIMDAYKAVNIPLGHQIDDMLSAHYSCPYYRTYLDLCVQRLRYMGPL